MMMMRVVDDAGVWAFPRAHCGWIDGWMDGWAFVVLLMCGVGCERGGRERERTFLQKISFEAGLASPCIRPARARAAVSVVKNAAGWMAVCAAASLIMLRAGWLSVLLLLFLRCRALVRAGVGGASSYCVLRACRS